MIQIVKIHGENNNNNKKTRKLNINEFIFNKQLKCVSSRISNAITRLSHEKGEIKF